jgi:hypothetical protein
MPSKKNATPANPPPPPEEPEGPPPPEPTPPVQVLYCSGFLFTSHIHVRRLTLSFCLVCAYPPEYCEFGSSLTKCKEWLHEQHPDLYDKYYSEGTFLRLSLRVTLAETTICRGSQCKSWDP